MGSLKHKKSSLFILLGTFIALAEGKKLKNYNDRCIPYDSSATCDSTQGLICLDSGLKGYRCLCPSNKLHAQIFDHKRSTCVGKVFNACVLNGKKVSSGGNVNVSESLCVQNAKCEAKMFHIPVCVCKAGYSEADDGHCVPTLKHGESCYDPTDDNISSTTEGSEGSEGSKKEEEGLNRGKKCDEKHGQVCLEGRCQCRYPSEQYYDLKMEKCVSYAGARCTHGDGHLYSCVANARCNAPPFRLHTGSSFAKPIGLLPPFPPFLGGLVQAAAASASASGSASHRGDDETDEDTTIFMMPLRPRLPPPPPGPHHHHPHSHPHAPPLHGPIHSREDPLLDFDTSFDHFDFSRSIFFGGSENKEVQDQEPRCECLSGFTRTTEGFCKLGYGSKCNPDSDDLDEGQDIMTRELCNADQFLECMDSHEGSFSCQCRNQMNERYDPVQKQCVSLIGRKCRPLGKYPKCENGSQCIDGTCQCGNGTSLTPMENSCMKNYGESCEPGECNGFRGFTCHGKSKTCLCIDSFLRYDEVKRACVNSRGGMCGLVKNRKDIIVQCEDGTKCEEKEVAGMKIRSRCI